MITMSSFNLIQILNEEEQCRNPNLGLVTKAGVCKGAGPKGSLGVTSHALGSVGECEGMNIHTPK
jgi:hypothetical protein